MFTPCESTFRLERHLIPYLQDNAFYAELSRQLRKVQTRDIPTAAIAYNPADDQITLFINPDFMGSLSDREIRGVIEHEFNHMTFGHLTGRRKNPARMWNVATDLAINSLIIEYAKNTSGSDRILPRFVLVPGQWPVHPDGRELSKEEKDAGELAALIASFPTMKSSDWYFNKIMEAAKKSKQKGKGKADPNGAPFVGEDWIDSMDDHDGWDELNDEQREYIEGKVKSIIEKAVRHADQRADGWGNIPAEIRDQIRKSVSHVINWRNVLRQFIGTLVRGGRTTSIKRINRRYPYIHPGIKRGYVAKLLVARDESGSVSDEMLSEFFAEMSALTKKVEIDFIPFDCHCSDKDIVRWSKGTVPAKATMRTKAGGTDFSAPTKVFNDPKNRGRWDGLLILTDGGAGEPIACRGKRAWALAAGCSLMFNTNELQVFVTKDKPMIGAWR